MARLFFHFLAIYSNENLPISIQVVPKWVHNFAQYQMNLENIANISTFCQSGKISPNLITLITMLLVSGLCKKLCAHHWTFFEVDTWRYGQRHVPREHPLPERHQVAGAHPRVAVQGHPVKGPEGQHHLRLKRG